MERNVKSSLAKVLGVDESMESEELIEVYRERKENGKIAV